MTNSVLVIEAAHGEVRKGDKVRHFFRVRRVPNRNAAK
jgi:hypothetical protein